MFIYLEACLFLSELSGLAGSLELEGEAQEGLHSQQVQSMLNFKYVGMWVHSSQIRGTERSRRMGYVPFGTDKRRRENININVCFIYMMPFYLPIDPKRLLGH